MICGRCGSHAVEWKGPLSDLTHTECGRCGAINAQDLEPMRHRCETCEVVDGHDLDCPENEIP